MMKFSLVRSSSLIALFTLGNILAFGQYKSPAGSLNLGIATYQGLSFMEGAQFLNTKPTYAQQTGLSLKYYQTITISLQLDILYSTMGGNYTRMERLSTQNTVEVDTKQKVHYVSLPLSINFYLSDRFESENVHIKLGAVTSFLLNAKITNTNPEEPLNDYKNPDSFRSLDFGFMGGVGIELHRINLSLEYYLGVVNINAEPNGSKITNHGPRIGLNYFLFRWD